MQVSKPLQNHCIVKEIAQSTRYSRLLLRFFNAVLFAEASRATPQHVQVFPDIGVASYLKNQWADAAFTITSLNDRKPVSGEEDLVILAAPDPPGADDCIRVNRMVPTSTPIVLLNPRIVSGADPPTLTLRTCILRLRHDIT
jgi:hypothetical protein